MSTCVRKLLLLPLLYLWFFTTPAAALGFESFECITDNDAGDCAIGTAQLSMTIVETGGERRELSGGSPHSTNNIMEMTAAIEAIRLIPPGARVTLTTDSQYLKNGITRWIRTWKRNGWRTAAGDAVKNRALWGELESLVGARQVAWEWVRGHAGHPENERVDFLANAARAEV